ncbi:mitotic checkpoint protein with homology with MAD2 [Phaeodactylum tricornutum CCAP 1055/1]|jgi:mitotic spindle assembly checkpoint protein MAD2|uniref:Mitotic checkpoint protein with homology with MAD2 n=2 Tax=Phaeodactylum tricornutum TaxID=2850 RepID=B7G224_PHATC|nr:mitotic checkpoint protein with homology with MAD2 [Phaeodactylum tricornutum CCAP 1055/1]EEC47225.1 mitotic checkpoint protein with homology with MAD2 [Phaeodactylum tricornutum CCAP 1055/1]|eukprot:XP_002181302.1 mitotic checkpoint protein with homology with MAD2 [Phaeodactylum tricornutum CCAP 1055/1]
MTSTATANKTEITLKGSVEIVSDFFFTAINSILYQRGIYMPETFKRESKHGLTVLTTTDEGLLRYLSTVQTHVTQWLLAGHVQRLVVVVQGVDSLETLERWQFNVTVEQDNENDQPNKGGGKKVGNKTAKEIHNEIQAIIRQVTASVTFLPLLQEPCTFDLLVYTDKDVEADEQWADSDPCYILNSAEVKLRSFSTSVHKIESMVAYKEADEWEL